MAETQNAAALAALEAPPEIRAAIARLGDDLARAAGTNLAGLILYGGLARGRYRPGKSDINIVVLLNDTQASALAAIAPTLRAAWRAWRVEPFVIRPAEVARLSVTFPTKLLDIARHHLVLAGANPFADIQVSRQQIRLRIEQGLRNSELRLRRRYLSIFDDTQSLATTLAEVAASLKVDFAAMLQLANRDAPSEATSAAVLEAAAEAFDLDRATLARIAALRREADPSDDLPALYDRALAVIARAAEIVSAME
ncbi:MAG TPA: nucleotidyltransferase domain-containing protein [Blastocatellia bacterium]|nr:nucleotidyltransferase domain-containing protein [Blastocatellia bacterium]